MATETTSMVETKSVRQVGSTQPVPSDKLYSRQLLKRTGLRTVLQTDDRETSPLIREFEVHCEVIAKRQYLLLANRNLHFSIGMHFHDTNAYGKSRHHDLNCLSTDFADYFNFHEFNAFKEVDPQAQPKTEVK